MSKLLLFVFAFLLLIGAAAAEEQLTFNEKFISTSDTYGLKVSPNGEHLAGVRRQNGQSYIFILKLDDLTAKPAYIPLDKAEVDWVAWGTDDRLLFAATTWIGHSRRIVAVDELVNTTSRGYRRLYAADRDGKNLIQFFQNDYKTRNSRNLTNITDFLRDDPDHVLIPSRISGELDLLKLNIFTGKYERVAEGGERTFRWFTNKIGEPAFRFDFNSTYSIVKIKIPQENSKGFTVWKTIENIPFRNVREEAKPDFAPIIPGPSPETYYVAARPDGADKAGIYLYDFRNDKYLETLKVHDEVDVDTVIIDARTHEFFGTAYYEDRLIYDIVEKDAAEHFNALASYFGDQTNLRVVSNSRDDMIWIIYAEGPLDAGSYHIYNRRTGSIDEIANRLIGLDRGSLSPMDVIKYESRDGLKLVGYLTRPVSAKPGDTPPLIVLPHGGPVSRDAIDFDPLVQILASKGYQVFQPNFRGSSGYGRAFEEAGYGQWGLAMQDDISDGVAFLDEQGLIDSENACILGASYGGYSALAAAALRPDEFNCAISIAGVSDLLKQLDYEKDKWLDNEIYRIWVQRIGHPRKDNERLKATSPRLHAEAVKNPVLLIHGEEDRIVPIEQSKIMVSALKKADKEVEFVELPHSTHSYRGMNDRETETRAILDFLAKHLPVAD